jgi:outer membrane protein TolC
MLASNPDLKAAQDRLVASREAIDQARSAWYPRVVASGLYARSDNPPQAFMMALNQKTFSMDQDFNNPPDTDNLRASMGVQYRVYDGGKRSLDIRQADLQTRLNQWALEAAQNALIHEVTRAYFGVLQARSFMQVNEEALMSLAESRRVVSERLSAGAVVKSDLLNVDVKIAEAREDLIRSSNGWTLALAALNTTIGTRYVSFDRALDPVQAIQIRQPLPREDPISRRPELAIARLAVAARQIEADRGRKDYLPTLSAQGSVDWDSDPGEDFERSYWVGLVAEWEAFDGFRRKHAVRSAQASVRAAEQDLASLTNRLMYDWNDAYLQVQAASQRLEVTRVAKVTAEEALRMIQERYQKGAADITDVLAAQVAETAMRTRDWSAFYDYLVACSNVKRAEGELVRFYQPVNRP